MKIGEIFFVIIVVIIYALIRYYFIPKLFSNKKESNISDSYRNNQDLLQK